MIIVVAWTVETAVHDGKPYAADRGERAGLTKATRPACATWKIDGAEADVDKARAYVAREEPETGRVFVYDASEQDPHGRARADVMASRA